MRAGRLSGSLLPFCAFLAIVWLCLIFPLRMIFNDSDDRSTIISNLTAKVRGLESELAQVRWQLDQQRRQQILDSYGHSAKKVKNCDRWTQIVQTLRQCILDGVEKAPFGQFWIYLSPAVETCAVLVRKLLNTKFFANKDDVKGFINFYHGSSALAFNACTALTIGIGGDIVAEQQLLKEIPSCRMFGVDPSETTGKIFESIGTYVPVAISNRTGRFKASILPKLGDSQIFNYEERLVDTVEFTEFLRHRMRISVVDFLFIDSEGAEYRLLPMFSYGGAIQRNNLTICQVSVEVHGPPERFGMRTKQELDQLLWKFLTESPFVPLWAPDPTQHHRLFAINVENEICVRKFYQYFC